MLREGRCVVLPSQRTLRDYTQYVQASTGFSTKVDKQLMDAANVKEAEDWQRCVPIVIERCISRMSVFMTSTQVPAHDGEWY